MKNYFFSGSLTDGKLDLDTLGKHSTSVLYTQPWKVVSVPDTTLKNQKKDYSFVSWTMVTSRCNTNFVILALEPY